MARYLAPGPRQRFCHGHPRGVRECNDRGTFSEARPVPLGDLENPRCPKKREFLSTGSISIEVHVDAYWLEKHRNRRMVTMSLHYRARKFFPVLAFSTLAWLSATAQAEEGRCLIIHVPQESADAFDQALNIANNLPKQLGADAARVYVIAQGPGLKLLTKGSPEAERITSLAASADQTLGGGTEFLACAATIAGIKKRTGKEPELAEGVEVTHPGAVAKVMDLHYGEGCAYIRI
jgi:intracellular sulfur oxidation DsrE/DsrF family protein